VRALVINLDRSIERLAEFQVEAERCGLDFERLPAVDGRALPAEKLAEITTPAFRFQPIGPAEIGNFLSHRKAWQVLVESGAGWIAVFEDDVRLADDLPAVLDAIEADDPPFDIVRLETTLRRVVLDNEGVDLVAGRRMHRMRSWHGGTAAYVIRRDCATRLLKATERLSDPIDQLLFNPQSRLFPSLRTAQLVPATAVQVAILDPQAAGGAASSTIGRLAADGSRSWRPRHGLAVGVHRLLLKLRERARRAVDMRLPGRGYRQVSFEPGPGRRA
jgi:glycosyl transferase family 25